MFRKKHSDIIPDRYSSYVEVSNALRTAGLEHSQLVVGVDFTLSNTWNGKETFNGASLHELTCAESNPYVEVLTSISSSLKGFDADNLIPAYGFGDDRTKQHNIFSFQNEVMPCVGLDGVLEVYKQIAEAVTLSGPTSFAPLIRHTIDIVRKTEQFHILVIVADGMVEHPEETIDAIIEASAYAMSIVMVGVGDGDWDLMEYFDEGIRARTFDNFQFVKFTSLVHGDDVEAANAKFAMRALMEIPSQYQIIKEKGFLRPDRNLPKFVTPPEVLDPPEPPPKPVEPDPVSPIPKQGTLHPFSTYHILDSVIVKGNEPIHLAAHSPSRRSRHARRFDMTSRHPGVPLPRGNHRNVWSVR
jgi:E3 ubiquitin-protein ligase RGLG